MFVLVLALTMLWICVRLIAWERVFCCLRGNYIFMLSCTSVRVRARCLFSCSAKTHQVWLLFRRHHSVSIMTVRLTNVNLKSSNSPLPLGVNQHAVTDYLGFLGLFLHFLLNIWNCSTDGNRKMKHSRITVFIHQRFCAEHHLLSDEARN